MMRGIEECRAPSVKDGRPCSARGSVAHTWHSAGGPSCYGNTSETLLISHFTCKIRLHTKRFNDNLLAVIDMYATSLNMAHLGPVLDKSSCSVFQVLDEKFNINEL